MFFFPSHGKAQTINLQGLRGNYYTTNNNDSANGLFGIGYYVKGMDDIYNVRLSYGVEGYYFGTATVSGYIVQEQLFNNLHYKYQVQNLPIYAAVKGIVNNNPLYNITLNAGIGPNFMRAKNYIETPRTSFSIPQNSFSSNSSVAFSAMVGIGARLNNVFGYAPLEIGYRFFYLGQGHLNRNNNQILNNLKTGNNYANAIVCSMSF